jgi:hypothetical protein
LLGAAVGVITLPISIVMISQIPGLHPGSIFQGHQRSGKHSYPVTVEIKHVDIADSYMCGHLSIGGLVSGVNNVYHSVYIMLRFLDSTSLFASFHRLQIFQF